MMQKFLLILLFSALFKLYGQNDNLNLMIIDQQLLGDLPSASGLEIINGKIYVVGDDSPYLFELNNDFEIVNKSALSGNYSTEGKRVNKNIKADYESMAVFKDNEGKYNLLAISSGSKDITRDTIKVFSISSKKLITSKSLRPLYDKISRQAGLNNEINIEASAVSVDRVFLLQRGLNQDNILFIFDKKEFFNYVFFNNSILPKAEIRKFKLNKMENTVAGFSGACLSADGNSLIFTASLEATSNAYEDGEILGSYIGILNLSNKDENINTALLTNDGKTVKTKLEGIAIESVNKDNYTLITVSDMDDGTSMIFRIRMKF